MDKWLKRYFDETEMSEDMPVDVLPASNGEFIGGNSTVYLVRGEQYDRLPGTPASISDDGKVLTGLANAPTNGPVTWHC